MLTSAFFVAAASAAALTVALLIGEALAERRDRKRYPPPGRVLPHSQLHVYEQGAGPFTVILESGLAATSISWLTIQQQAAEFARVISYDRAGLGWSKAQTGKPALYDILADLSEVAAGSRSLILVGHSFGGLIVQAFANRHAEEIAGLVLIDPVSIAHWSNPVPPQQQRLNRGIRLSRRGAWLARFAVVRIALSLVARGSRKLPIAIGRVSAGRGSAVMSRLAGEVAKLPREAYGPVRAHWSRPSSFERMADYLELLPPAAKLASGMPVPASIPLTILSAATATSEELKEREKWASHHPASRHVQVPDTTHWVQLDRPDLIVEAIRDQIAHSLIIRA